MTELSVCRACTSTQLDPVLSLGHTPLANALCGTADAARACERFPLELILCAACSLLQIKESVPPEKLFSHYVYFSSFSDTMLRHAETLVKRMVDERHLSSQSLVVEVASNDGYLLQYYARAGVSVLGVEPAQNIAEVARGKGIETLSEFFGASLATKLASQGRRADVIHGHNVLAHVPDLPGFVRGLGTLLNDNGVVVIEVPYMKDFIDRWEFDTIYHEHLSYFSLTALDRLFRSQGLTIWRVERISLHGGSLRFFSSHDGSAAVERSVTELLSDEARWGVNDVSTYAEFSRCAPQVRDRLRSLLRGLKETGASIVAYGAAAKGATLLNYSDVGAEFIDYVVDRSPHKQGKYMPGVALPILPLESIRGSARPDYLLLLAWNFADEITFQQRDFSTAGGKFILPIPTPHIL